MRNDAEHAAQVSEKLISGAPANDEDERVFDDLMAHLKRQHYFGDIIISLKDGEVTMLRFNQAFKRPIDALRAHKNSGA